MYTIGIDAGNSRIKLGLFRDSKLVGVKTADTEAAACLDVPAAWKALNPGRIGLSSVVPSVNAAIKKRFCEIYGKRVSLIKPSDCGITLSIKNPGTVGVDRILNCRAALELFGPRVIVVDAGTAVTVDSATEKDGFTGGSIIPGAGLWMKSLTRTAMIGENAAVKASFPGKNTAGAISAGIKYGIPGAVNGILAAAVKKYPSAVIILTGGGAAALRGKMHFRCITRKHLTLEGIGFVLDGRENGN